MKEAWLIFGLLLAAGCASNEAVYRNYTNLVNVSDGVSEKEAKIIAQKTIISVPEQRDYRLTAPDIRTNVGAEKYPGYWFVVFGHNWLSPISTDPMAKTYTELKETQFLVVIDKKNGDIKFCGQWYPKRADNFDWIFDPESFRAVHSLELFPGEPVTPGRR